MAPSGSPRHPKPKLPPNLEELKTGPDGVRQVSDERLIKHIVGGGWVEETMKVYNSGVKKFVKFNEQKGRNRERCLPAEKEMIYDFILWACKRKDPSETSAEAVKADTVRKYLVGLKAWHRLHQQRFPEVDEEVIRLMLRASKNYEAE
ncbi:hypothetical protein DFH28DRAFT_904430, partial [Melampsora americana]